MEKGKDFPDDFKKYRDAELSWWGEDHWVFWSRADDERECPQTFLHNGSDFTLTTSREFKEKIKLALRKIILTPRFYQLLVQFWAPIPIEGGRSLLTTQNQPFALRTIDEGLCGYRMISKEYKFCADEESGENLGLPGRVFLHKLPESTPNVEYYSSKEYPQRDDALRCQVRQSLALPVLEPSSGSCVGVLELATTSVHSSLILEQRYAFNAFEEHGAGLKCLDVYTHSCMQHKDKNEGFAAATDEIRKLLKVVCGVSDLRLAHTWVPCGLCRAVVDGASCVSQVMSTMESVSYPMDEDIKKDWFFRFACDSFHLRKGQGVVGRALSSHNPLFCTDVTQFSIVEYPLTHHAREYKLSSCFAICLRSNHTGNDIYVLEFFLPESNEATGNLQTSLRLILATMKLFCQTFKLASGEDLEEELPIQVIDFHNGEKLCYTLKPQTVLISPPRPEASQTTRSSSTRLEALRNGVEMMQQLDPSDQQQSMDPTNNGRNVASAAQSDSTVTYSSQENGTLKKLLGRPKRGTGFQINLEELLRYTGMKRIDAAKSLGVSQSTLKRVCREYGIPRWPPRKIGKDNSSLPIENFQHVDWEQIRQSSFDLPPKQGSATAMQAMNIVTIKAKYANDLTIKFDLSLPWRFVELQQQVTKRLNLEGGTYDIKYKDEEDDSILITCDDDLEKCICTRRLLGSTSIVVLLEPSHPITNWRP